MQVVFFLFNSEKLLMYWGCQSFISYQNVIVLFASRLFSFFSLKYFYNLFKISLTDVLLWFLCLEWLLFTIPDSTVLFILCTFISPISLTSKFLIKMSVSKYQSSSAFSLQTWTHSLGFPILSMAPSELSVTGPQIPKTFGVSYLLFSSLNRVQKFRLLYFHLKQRKPLNTVNFID